jgi:hypothetical protein
MQERWPGKAALLLARKSPQVVIDLLALSANGLIGSIVTATAGAVVLLFVVKSIKKALADADDFVDDRRYSAACIS